MLEFLSFLVVAGQGAATANPPAVEQQVVVIARRLRNWRARYRVRGNEVRCETTRSTGDPEIDSIGCLSFEMCIRQLRPRIDESDRPDLARSVRRAMKEGIERDLGSCVDARRDELIAELADRRFRARAGN